MRTFFVKSLIIYAFIYCLPHSLCGQVVIRSSGTGGFSLDFEIRATIRDSITNAPLDFATATLFRNDPSGKEEVYNYALSDTSGVVQFTKLPFSMSTYKLKIEYAGYFPKEIPNIAFDMEMFRENLRVKDLGVVLLQENVTALEALIVRGTANPIVYLGNDTIQYNAAAYDIKATDMLIDFLKRLPGWDINSDGKITVNGEVLDKITVNNRVFFVDDPAFVSKTLPAHIVENIKVYKESSDFSRTTGIDDGIKQNTANVKVKDGMLAGWIGEVSAGAGKGSSDVFSSNAFLARFSDRNQYAFSGTAGNVNTSQLSMEGMGGAITMGMGMMGMGMMGMGSYGGGVSTDWNLGTNANLSSKNNKLKTDLSYSVSGSDGVSEDESHQEEYLENNTLMKDAFFRNNSISTNHRVNATMRYESQKSSFSIMPNASYSHRIIDVFRDETSYNADGSMINESESIRNSRNNSISTGLNMTYSRKFNKPLRALTVSGRFSFSETESDGYNQSTVKFHALGREDVTDQKNTSLNTSHNIYSMISYYEPLKNNFFFNIAYSLSSVSSKSEREYLNKDEHGNYTQLDTDFSDRYRNLDVTHSIGAFINKQRTADSKVSYRVGVNVLPKSMTSTGDNIDDLKQNVVNFSPNASFEYAHSQFRTVRFTYMGSTSAPRLSQLQPVPDNTNPLYYALGNPNLVPEFSNNFNLATSYSKAKSLPHNNAIHQVTLGGGFTLNQIINKIWYDEGGVRYSMPVNENGNYNIRVGHIFYKSFFKNKLSISNQIFSSFRNGISYVNDKRNETETLSFSEGVQINYRINRINVGTSMNVTYENAWYSVNTMTRSASWNNGVNLNFGWTLPKEIKLGTNAAYRFYAGYNAGYNDPYFVWNANLSAPILRQSLFLSFMANDILNTNKNIRRTITDNMLIEGKSNMISQYFMLHLTYKFMSGKNATGAFKDRANRALNSAKMGGSETVTFIVQ